MTGFEPGGQFDLFAVPRASLPMLLEGSVVGAVVAAFVGAPLRSPVIAGGIGGTLGGWVGFLAVWDVIGDASPGTIWGTSLLGTLVGSLVLSTLAARREKRAWIKRNPWMAVVLVALLLIFHSWSLMPIDWDGLEGHGELYCLWQCGYPRRTSTPWCEKGHCFNTWGYGHHYIDFVDGTCVSVFEEGPKGSRRLYGQNKTVTVWQVIKHLF